MTKPLEIQKKTNLIGTSVLVETIMHLVQEREITIIHTTGITTIASIRQLNQFEKILLPYGFKRVNANTIVNPVHIDYISNNGAIILKDGTKIESRN